MGPSSASTAATAAATLSGSLTSTRAADGPCRRRRGDLADRLVDRVGQVEAAHRGAVGGEAQRGGAADAGGGAGHDGGASVEAGACGHVVLLRWVGGGRGPRPYRAKREHVLVSRSSSAVGVRGAMRRRHASIGGWPTTTLRVAARGAHPPRELVVSLQRVRRAGRPARQQDGHPGRARLRRGGVAVAPAGPARAGPGAARPGRARSWSTRSAASCATGPSPRSASSPASPQALHVEAPRRKTKPVEGGQGASAPGQEAAVRDQGQPASTQVRPLIPERGADRRTGWTAVQQTRTRSSTVGVRPSQASRGKR